MCSKNLLWTGAKSLPVRLTKYGGATTNDTVAAQQYFRDVGNVFAVDGCVRGGPPAGAKDDCAA